MKQDDQRKAKEKNNAGVREEIRGLGVLIEHVDDKISLIAEQYGDIKKTLHSNAKILDSHTKTLDRHTEILDSHTKTLDQHTEILDSHTKTLDQHTEMLDGHTKTLDQHTEILGNHTDMIGSIKMDIEVIKEDIAFMKGGLKRKVDADEFSVLERRVALLEKRR